MHQLIQLTKLDKAPVVLHPEAIKYVEAIPDTLIHFLNGDTLIVLESLQDIIAKTVALKQAILSCSGSAPAQG
jgi:flagellar protein FlbD